MCFALYSTSAFARSRTITGSRSANHFPEFMSTVVPDRPHRQGGHPARHGLCWFQGGRQGLLPGTVESARWASLYFDNAHCIGKAAWENNCRSSPLGALWHLPVVNAECVPECVVCSGGLRRASRLPDGERDLGAGRGGEFRTGLRSAKQAGRVCTSDQLLQLHHEHNTRAPAVWQS